MGTRGNSRYTRVGKGVYARACTYSIRIPVPWYLYPTRYLHLPRGTYPSLPSTGRMPGRGPRVYRRVVGV